ALGLGDAWEARADGGLWQRDLATLPVHDREAARKPPPTPPALSPDQQAEALALVAVGQTLRQVGAHFGVSYGAIWRLQQAEKSQLEGKQERAGTSGAGRATGERGRGVDAAVEEAGEAGEEDPEV